MTQRSKTDFRRGAFDGCWRCCCLPADVNRSPCCVQEEEVRERLPSSRSLPPWGRPASMSVARPPLGRQRGLRAGQPWGEGSVTGGVLGKQASRVHAGISGHAWRRTDPQSAALQRNALLPETAAAAAFKGGRKFYCPVSSRIFEKKIFLWRGPTTRTWRSTRQGFEPGCGKDGRPLNQEAPSFLYCGCWNAEVMTDL